MEVAKPSVDPEAVRITPVIAGQHPNVASGRDSKNLREAMMAGIHGVQVSLAVHREWVSTNANAQCPVFVCGRIEVTQFSFGSETPDDIPKV
jgi:hypothetical protein